MAPTVDRIKIQPLVEEGDAVDDAGGGVACGDDGTLDGAEDR